MSKQRASTLDKVRLFLRGRKGKETGTETSSVSSAASTNQNKDDSVEKLNEDDAVEKLHKDEDDVAVEKLNKEDTVEELNEDDAVENLSKDDAVENLSKYDFVGKLNKDDAVEKLEEVKEVTEPTTTTSDLIQKPVTAFKSEAYVVSEPPPEIEDTQNLSGSVALRRESSGKLVRTQKCMRLVTKPIDQLGDDELLFSDTLRSLSMVSHISPSELDDSSLSSIPSRDSFAGWLITGDDDDEDIDFGDTTRITSYGDEFISGTYDKSLRVISEPEGRTQCRKCSTDPTANLDEVMLHFISFTPYPKMRQQLAQNTMNSFSINWKVLNHEDWVSLPRLVDKELILDAKRSYPLKLNKMVHLYLSRCPVHFELHHTPTDDDRLISTCKLSLKPALENVGKVFEVRLQLDNEELKMCYKNLRHELCGLLVLRFGIMGDQETISSFKTPEPTLPHKPSMQIENEKIKTDWAEKKVPQDDVDLIRHNLAMTLVRNKVLRTTSEAISAKLDRYVNWVHAELYWQLSLQEAAILEGNNPHGVLWRQWKDDDNERVAYRPQTNHRFNDDASLEIVLERLRIHPYSSVAFDESVQHVYLEYAFLDREGVEMETTTKPKSPDINFNFRRTFMLPKNSNEARMLLDMIVNKENFVVIVVSEPKNESEYVQASWEIGRCSINLFDVLQDFTDKVTSEYPVNNEEGEEIGTLWISFVGVFSVRSLALSTLAPKDFSIIR